MNYNSVDYTPSILLEDEISYFHMLLGLSDGQFICGGVCSEVVDNVIVPIRGNAYRYKAEELSHAVYLTKLKFNRVNK